MTHTTFSSETLTPTSAQQSFWLLVEQGRFTAKDGVELAYCVASHPNNKQAIVISNGRVESYLKYQEIIFDLFHQGYDVYAIDHRGQGLSQRMTTNPQQGFVYDFNEYVDDLELFIDEQVRPKQYQHLHCLAHSMGSAIATLLMAKQPKWFSSAVFSAPMFGIQLPVHKNIIIWLANILNTCRRQDELYKANYIIAGTDYQPDSFAKNKLTHSQARYHVYRDLYEANPQIQLGAPTNQWLLEAIKAADECVLLSAGITTPRLILQAEAEKIVCNKSQDACLNVNCSKVIIKDAFHEVLIETDARRNHALNETLAFMKRHSKTVAI
ncbi:alpha/beta fold hydrolase [Shewanella maritima]|uniref:alpha/beta fold hydrolase n=1 Tax=Shewanella maritima TaxID=2520507 RepID=UPI003736159C